MMTGTCAENASWISQSAMSLVCEPVTRQQPRDGGDRRHQQALVENIDGRHFEIDQPHARQPAPAIEQSPSSVATQMPAAPSVSGDLFPP